MASCRCSSSRWSSPACCRVAAASPSASAKPGGGNTDEDIVLRIKADAPRLKPDEPVPANPVL
jgi:hypothetical protein